MFRRVHAALMLSTIVALLAAAAASAPAQEKEPRVTGRPPAYYKDVVDAQQKTAIYKLQAEYKIKKKELEARYETLTAEIKKLREDIDSLKTTERDAIEKILTPEQLSQVKKTQADAQARRAQAALKAAQEAANRAGQPE